MAHEACHVSRGGRIFTEFRTCLLLGLVKPCYYLAEKHKICTNSDYPIPIKIRAPLKFAPLIFAHPQISCPFNFGAPLFYCKFAFFHSFVAFFLLPLIFAHSYCANLIPLIFAQARCANIKGARILMGIR